MKVIRNYDHFQLNVIRTHFVCNSRTCLIKTGAKMGKTLKNTMFAHAHTMFYNLLMCVNSRQEDLHNINSPNNSI